MFFLISFFSFSYCFFKKNLKKVLVFLEGRVKFGELGVVGA